MKQLPIHIQEINVSYKVDRRKIEKVKIKSSADVYNYALKIYDEDTIEMKEDFKIILLNRRNSILGFHNLSLGGISQTTIDLTVLFSIAIKGLASALILVHNHPSGETDPNQADIEITKRIQEIGEIVNISVFDHVIISNNGYTSLADEGLM